MMRRRGVTLLEMALALSLLVFLLTLLMRFYHNSLYSRSQGMAMLKEANLARVLLRQITDEIRQAGGFVPGFGPGIIGERYTLTVQTLTVPNRELYRERSVREQPLPGQHDVKQVRYFIAWDEDITDEEGLPLALGLVRQELKTLRRQVIIADGISEREAEEQDLDAEQSFKLQLYAPEIKYLEFRYYDGSEWHKDWQVAEGNPLPQMVRVTLGYETQEQEDMDIGFIEEDFEFEEDEIFPPRSYTAYVRIVQADPFFGSRISRAARDLAEGGI